MIIKGKKVVGAFHKKHPDHRIPIKAWEQRVQSAAWRSRTDIELTFPFVDFHSEHGCYIFDIGKKYRLIAQIFFVTESLAVGEVLVRSIMHHDEYER